MFEVSEHLTTHLNAYLMHDESEYSADRTEAHWSLLRAVHFYYFNAVRPEPCWTKSFETGPQVVVALVKRIFLNSTYFSSIFALCSTGYDRQQNIVSKNISNMEAGTYELFMAQSRKPAPEWHTQEDMYKALLLLTLVHQAVGEFILADQAYEKAFCISMTDTTSRACLIDVLKWAVRLECFILKMRRDFHARGRAWWSDDWREPYFEAYFRDCEEGG